MFQFEAQTGKILPFHQVISGHFAPSNFYRFIFYNEELAWVKRQVKEAGIGSSGLDYPYLILQRFHAKDLRPAIDRGRTIFE